MADSTRRVEGWTAQRMMTVALVVGLAAAALWLILQFLAATAEPTIRIRGGSVVVEIDAAEWVEKGPPKWSHNGEERENERYTAQLTTSSGTTCPDITGPVEQVRIKTSDNQQVILIINNKRTLVNPGGGELKKEQPRVLRLVETKEGAFVEELHLHGTGTGAPWSCTFTMKGQFELLTLSDE